MSNISKQFPLERGTKVNPGYQLVIPHEVDEDGFDFTVVGDADEETLLEIGIDLEDDEPEEFEA